MGIFWEKRKDSDTYEADAEKSFWVMQERRNSE